jgi:hypothetical protein
VGPQGTPGFAAAFRAISFSGIEVSATGPGSLSTLTTLTVTAPTDGLLLVSGTATCSSQPSNGHLNIAIATTPVWVQEASATETLSGGFKSLAAQTVIPVGGNDPTEIYLTALINEPVPLITCWGQLSAVFSESQLE